MYKVFQISNWFKERTLVIAVLGLVIISLVIHFTLFDGIHAGNIKGVVTKPYVKTYNSFRVGSTNTQKAKVTLENGDLITVICKTKCFINTNISVDIYNPLLFGKTVYVYENTPNKLFKRDK